MVRAARDERGQVVASVLAVVSLVVIVGFSALLALRHLRHRPAPPEMAAGV